MLVFGLVQDGGWDPSEDGRDMPEYEPPARQPWTWRLPWKPLAWFAAWCWLMALVPIVNTAFGALAGYGMLLLAVGLACWRLERFCGRQYWHGMREYKY